MFNRFLVLVCLRKKVLPRGAWAKRRFVRRGLLGEWIERSRAAVSRAGRWKNDGEKQEKA